MCLIDDAHSKVLNPATSTFALEREVLAPEVKLELLLAAQEDLEKFAHEVKQIKDLEHVVSGSDFDGTELYSQCLFFTDCFFLSYRNFRTQISTIGSCTHRPNN